MMQLPPAALALTNAFSATLIIPSTVSTSAWISPVTP
jgi:hypothetical protein